MAISTNFQTQFKKITISLFQKNKTYINIGYIDLKIINIEDALWVATQKGIKKIELNHKDLSNSKIVDAFYDADGLLQNNTNDIYLKDNFLYAASDMGLAKLNFTSPIYRQQPKLYFKSNLYQF